MSSGNNSSDALASSPDHLQCHEQLLIRDFWVRLVLCLLYLIIFVIGVIGNVLVVLVVVRNKAMHSPTNLFIVNMAVSDVLMCLFAVPFTPLHSFMDQWIFGDVLCKLFPTSQGVSVYMSTLTLTCIAVDRYMAIVHPYRPRMENRTALVLVCIVNALALLFTAPYAYHMGAQEDSSGVVLCSESWHGMHRTFYGAFTNITQFVLPFTTIFVCYGVIMARLAKRFTARPGCARSSAAKEEAEKERKKKNNRLCVAMVVIFGTCWLPLNAINFIADINVFPIYCWEYHHLTFFLCHILAMSSNCYNPFLYGWLNDNFRTEFLRMIPALATLCGSCGDDQQSHNQSEERLVRRPSTQPPCHSVAAAGVEEVNLVPSENNGNASCSQVIATASGDHVGPETKTTLLLTPAAAAIQDHHEGPTEV